MSDRCYELERTQAEVFAKMSAELATYIASIEKQQFPTQFARSMISTRECLVWTAKTMKMDLDIAKALNDMEKPLEAAVVIWQNNNSRNYEAIITLAAHRHRFKQVTSRAD